ncbi:UDP-N-acetylmuramate--L-alanine ligase [Granulicatella sp. zg-ZJ]|uniref:UDP-N-acetylmuramate--L-alanine ligase n=1 Tax=unclassified Granulicatella TaxID=2630493 RepID=UPI0013C1C168|nr:MULTISPECIES: UDP-N-acetylmuramate--L-alanine ligase [unclassified Granulicatella]NEW62241.1 UDP-N-acetylmuramate--L-alanine ligase [Granulicatella sp. zg-ZJ]NEW65857.1 UDP-N-acetylmuramate--L-alanine ligase [Granulicatella sp. zg-84]QMI86394.1 UDP-N-acetylmuramate--L-alanine ligase [Carnobacteriaceae bacterium zg-84]
MTEEKIYHFTGIKGSGMSALALVLNGKGKKVQGSDKTEYFFTQKGLEDQRIPLYDFLQATLDNQHIVIAGNAYTDDHEELVQARENGAEVIRYHTFLGDLINQYTSVAITGSHGKTTTTGLLSHVLKTLKPTSYLIGDGTGFGANDAEYFVLEACEYRRHFLAYHPDYAIMTNVDFDHPDYYKNIDDVFSAFEAFAKQVKKIVVACGDDAYLPRLKSLGNVMYYGFKETNDFIARNIERAQDGSKFDVYVKEQFYGTFHIPTYGLHNVLNALGVISLCYLEGFKAEDVAKALLTFSGVKRRFSEKIVGSMTIIDDYAHHPSEIAATLDAVHQKYPDKEVIAVFQPHTFTRTVALLEQFAHVLSTADKVYLCDIFASARETVGDVTVQDLADKITKDVQILHKNNLSLLLDYKDAVIVFMGAGDINKIANDYTNLLGQLQLNKN